MNIFYRFVLRGFNVLYPCKVIGKDNVPEGGAILVCNHLWALDPAYVADVYNKDIKFLAKKELFEKKLFAKIIKSIGAISIDRENPELKTMLFLMRYLKDGHKLLIFPEGTRNKKGCTDLQELKGGSALFAIKAKVPIVPLFIKQRGKIFRRNYIYVGEPFELNEYYGMKMTDTEIKNAEKIIREQMLLSQKNLNDYIENKRKK